MLLVCTKKGQPKYIHITGKVYSSWETSILELQISFKHLDVLINHDTYIKTNRFTWFMTKSLIEKILKANFIFLWLPITYLELIHHPSSILWTDIELNTFLTLIMKNNFFFKRAPSVCQIIYNNDCASYFLWPLQRQFLSL